MDDFVLDARLQADCHILGELDAGLLLLLNNALVPWFILVPRTEATELYQLDSELQQKVWQEIDVLSRFVQAEFKVQKMNVAAIGNIVRQLHIHVVGRRQDDYCWPGVVWGAEGKVDYDQEQVQAITTLFKESYPGIFKE